MSRVVHFEIHAEDPARAAAFYTAALGWEIKKWEGGDGIDYWLVTTGDKKDIGINVAITKRLGPAPKGGEPINSYVDVIGVTDIDTTIANIEKAGGTVALAKNDIPKVGQLAYYKDTEGNIFGILQPVKMQS